VAVKKEGIENSQQGKQGGHVSIDFFLLKKHTQVPATVTSFFYLTTGNTFFHGPQISLLWG
jgi:hypothetical protein